MLKTKYVFKDIFTDITASVPRVDQNLYKENGPIPIIDQGASFISGYIETKQFYKPNDSVICFGDHSCSVKFINFNFVAGAQGLKVLKPCNQDFAKYLYYWLQYKRNFIPDRGYSRHFKWLKDFSIYLPNIDISKKRVKILDKIDCLIKIYTRRINLLELLVKSRFNEIINSKKIDNKIKLGDLGFFISGGTPSKFHAEYFDGGNIPFVTTPSLGKNYIDEKDAQYFITELGLKESSTKLISRDSILIGIRVGVGKSSINKKPLCINQDILAITNIKDGFTSLFLKLIIDRNVSRLNNLKRGATIQGITSKDIKNIDVPALSFSIQNELVKFIKQIDKSKLAVQKSIDQLEILKKSLMQEYFG